MSFSLDKEADVLLGDSARKFLSASSGRSAGAARPRADREASWMAVAAMGWLGLAVPESDGGFGGSGGQFLMLLEESGRALSDEPLLVNLLALKAFAPVLAPALSQRVMAGDARLAMLDGDSPRSAIRFDETPEGVRFTGSPGLSLGADCATHLLFHATHVNGCGQAVFVLPASDPSVAVAPQRLVDGCGAARVALSGPTSAAAMLARGEKAQQIASEARDLLAAGAAAEAYGAADAAFRLTLEYLKQRVQFGKPLSRLQAVQHSMADAYRSLEQQKSLLVWLGHAMDGGPQERMRAVSGAKSFAGGRCREAVETCIQLSGGIGMTDEYALGHFYKRVLARGALFGTADEHLWRLAMLGA
jgi:alkylation response protein AidB-like acyl-CoA dehydrogenase